MSSSNLTDQPSKPDRRSRLVTLLAILGVILLAVQAWGYGAWLFSSSLEPLRSPQPVPGDVVDRVRVAELSSLLGASAWLAYVAWDWSRKKTLTWPLLWTVTWACVYWQEPLVNVSTHTFSFNRAFHNLGDWTTYLPFVPSSYSPLPEALILEGLVFLYLLPLLATVVAAYMRLLRNRLRIRSPWILALIAYGTVAVFDWAFESRGIAQGLLRYVEIGGPALHEGRPTQWPLFQGFAIGAAWALPGIVTYLIRDHHAPEPRQHRPQWAIHRRSVSVTILAAVGAANLVFGVYNAGFVALMHGTTSEQPAWLSAPR